MTNVTRDRRSPIALAVLALLMEEPMHPYRMQQMIKQRGKDQVINIRQRASLYQTIARLLHDGLIAVRGTARNERRPERTIYQLTESGRQTAVGWLRGMLATPAREYPEFPVALAYLPLLSPEDARQQLERRVDQLTADIEEFDRQLRQAGAVVPRLFLVESEYQRLMWETELAWTRSLVDELASGQLNWDDSWIQSVAEQFEPGPAGAPPAQSALFPPDRSGAQGA
jgi:DNA-binding PadR family transcriptional regulator